MLVVTGRGPEVANLLRSQTRIEPIVGWGVQSRGGDLENRQRRRILGEWLSDTGLCEN